MGKVTSAAKDPQPILMIADIFNDSTYRHLGVILLACGLLLGMPSLRVGASPAQAGEAVRDDDTLTPLEGRKESGEVREISAGGEVFYHSQSGGEKKISLLALRRIEHQVSAVKAPPCAVYLAAKRGVLRVDGVEISEKKCRLDWSLSPGTELPLRLLAALVFKEKIASSLRALARMRFHEERGQAAAEDRLIVVNKGKVKIVRGVLVGVSDENVTFIFHDKKRLIARSKVYGVVLAQAAGGAESQYRGAVRVRLRDGGNFWARVNRLHDDSLSLRLGEVPLTLSWREVRRLEVWSTRLDFVSDLTPSEVRQSSIVSFPTTYQRDRSVLGRPLTLGTVTYEKGLGVHARCALTYNTAGQYKSFAATLGIDAETAGKGDCVFRVLADGREIFKRRLRGSDSPVIMRVDITGVESLVLEVAPGADLDLADHANWCDARFIR